MKNLTFQGYSDDTFACSGSGIDVDHDNCASGTPIFMKVESGSDGLIVVGHYAVGPCGGWMIGVSPLNPGSEDEKHIPEWPISFRRSDREYSPTLVIEAPDDVRVFLVDENGRDKARDFMDV